MQQQQPTKEQIANAAKQLTASIQLFERTIVLKKQERKGIVLTAKAKLGQLDIELGMIEAQLEQTRAMQEQNNKNMEGATSNLIVKPFAGLVRG